VNEWFWGLGRLGSFGFRGRERMDGLRELDADDLE
jgi:hypothetical protein